MVLIKSRPDYEGAKEHAIYILETRLPPNAPYYTEGELGFHGIHHTYDVISAMQRLIDRHNKLIVEGKIVGEPIGGKKREFLILTAAIHDIGYTDDYDNHEEVGISIAERILPHHGFDEDLIDVMGWMIRPTKMPQKPYEGNIFHYLMCDSDLDNFGRDDFFDLSHIYKLEIELVKKTKIPLIEWYENTYGVMKTHSYRSDAGKSIREGGKKQNMEELKRRVRLLEDAPSGKELRKLEMEFNPKG